MSIPSPLGSRIWDNMAWVLSFQRMAIWVFLWVVRRTGKSLSSVSSRSLGRVKKVGLGVGSPLEGPCRSISCTGVSLRWVLCGVPLPGSIHRWTPGEHSGLLKTRSWSDRADGNLKYLGQWGTLQSCHCSQRNSAHSWQLFYWSKSIHLCFPVLGAGRGVYLERIWHQRFIYWGGIFRNDQAPKKKLAWQQSRGLGSPPRGTWIFDSCGPRSEESDEGQYLLDPSLRIPSGP